MQASTVCECVSAVEPSCPPRPLALSLSTPEVLRMVCDAGVPYVTEHSTDTHILPFVQCGFLH